MPSRINYKMIRENIMTNINKKTSTLVTVNIAGYDVCRYTLESYLRSCKYNQLAGTEESDRMQNELYIELIESIGVSRISVAKNDQKFLNELNKFVYDTLYTEY